VSAALDLLAKKLSKVRGVITSPSGFADMDAWWVGGKEIAHVKRDVLDLRLTKAGIRARKAQLAAHPGVVMRKSGSDWVEIAIASKADADFAYTLFLEAVEAHRPRDGEGGKLPPTGAALARRRKFH
jgi:hypothetical protein